MTRNWSPRLYFVAGILVSGVSGNEAWYWEWNLVPRMGEMKIDLFVFITKVASLLINIDTRFSPKNVSHPWHVSL